MPEKKAGWFRRRSRETPGMPCGVRSGSGPRLLDRLFLLGPDLAVRAAPDFALLGAFVASSHSVFLLGWGCNVSSFYHRQATDINAELFRENE
jgi:hypothetical protein